MRILITGASGFLGQGLSQFLRSHKHEVILVSRQALKTDIPHYVCSDYFQLNWSRVLEGIDAIIHCAGLAHETDQARSKEEYFKINSELPAHIAREGYKAGVQHFVFLSSAKAAADSSLQPICETDSSTATTVYGLSKLKAELLLEKTSEETGLKITCIRPPLVYGPGVKANFLQLIRFVHFGLPFPVRMTFNQRSLIYSGNLFDFLCHILHHGDWRYECFFVSDGLDLSTDDLLKEISSSLGKKYRNLNLPYEIVRRGLKLLGRSRQLEKLNESLVVRTEKARRLTGWTPKFGFKDGLKETLKWYSSSH